MLSFDLSSYIYIYMNWERVLQNFQGKGVKVEELKN